MATGPIDYPTAKKSSKTLDNDEIKQVSEDRVDFPQFELVGPRCRNGSCKGTLIDTTNIKTGDWYKKCSICSKEFDRKPAMEKLNEVVETIEKVMNIVDQKTLTVAELIEKLQAMPQDRLVYSNHDIAFSPVIEVETKTDRDVGKVVVVWADH